VPSSVLSIARNGRSTSASNAAQCSGERAPTGCGPAVSATTLRKREQLPFSKCTRVQFVSGEVGWPQGESKVPWEGLHSQSREPQMRLATGFVFRPGLAQFAGRLTATVRAISGAENFSSSKQERRGLAGHFGIDFPSLISQQHRGTSYPPTVTPNCQR
jgi:hypothetical protein